MPEQAWAALAKLQLLTQDENLLEGLRAEIDAASQHAVAEESVEATIEEIEPDDIPVAEIPIAEIEETQPVVEAESAVPEVTEAVEIPIEIAPPTVVEPEPAEAVAHEHGHLQQVAAELDATLQGEFAPEMIAADAVAEPVAEIEPEPAPAAMVAETALAPADQKSTLGDFVSDLEASLGDDFLKGAPVPETAAPTLPSVPAPAVMRAAAAAAASSAPPAVAPSVAKSPAAAPVPPAPAAKLSPFGDEAGVDLAEMFGELKHDLESEAAPTEEDPETHYNLGIAFREMGLLDEAIGELQKTCQSFDRGRPFPQIMQTYTWLAQCFLDKGVPEAAVRWYQKALAVVGIDQETRVALHYELASAYESLGDKPSALKHFTEVYSSNIDYRDVAERLKALKS